MARINTARIAAVMVLKKNLSALREIWAMEFNILLVADGVGVAAVKVFSSCSGAMQWVAENEY
jgi:hypothetical protein